MGAGSLDRTGPDRLDEKPLGMADEWTLRVDLLVQLAEARSVLLGAETGDGPDHHPQEVDDRPDVEEFHAERLLTQITDPKTRCGRVRNGLCRPPRVADVDGTEEELGELVVRSRSDVLGQVGPTGLQDPRDLRPAPLIRMTGEHEVERRIVAELRRTIRRLHCTPVTIAIAVLTGWGLPRAKAKDALRHVERP